MPSTKPGLTGYMEREKKTLQWEGKVGGAFKPLGSYVLTVFLRAFRICELQRRSQFKVFIKFLKVP